MSGIKIIPAGGMSKVGERNGTIIKDGGDALVTDWGQKIPIYTSEEIGKTGNGSMEFLGEEYFPDIELLEGVRVKALCVTHGHMDHSEGWPKIYARWPGAPIVTDSFTAQVMSMRAEKANHTAFPSFLFGERAELDPFYIKRFPVNHSIFGASGFLIEVHGRRIVQPGDFKMWPVRNGDDKNAEMFGALLAGEKIDVLFMDATNAGEKGFVISEEMVGSELDNILEIESEGRVFCTAISSNARRLGKILTSAHWRMGRPVYVAGRSMQGFLELCGLEGWKNLSQKHSRFESNEARYLYPDPSRWESNAVILVTGSQAEPGSFLDNLASGEFSLPSRPGDVLVITQDPIPVPEILERWVAMVEELSRRFERIYITEDAPPLVSYGAEIIREEHLHASGHAKEGDMQRLFQILHPKLVIPCHADRAKRAIVADLVREWGGGASLLEDGETLEL